MDQEKITKFMNRSRPRGAGCFFVLSALVLLFSFEAKATDILAGPVENPANGHTYYLLASDYWEASEAAAVALGGHLVTVNDQVENDWVFDTFALFGGLSRTSWTRYHRTHSGGEFVWASGEAPGFVNWYPGKPATPRGPRTMPRLFRQRRIRWARSGSTCSPGRSTTAARFMGSSRSSRKHHHPTPVHVCARGRA